MAIRQRAWLAWRLPPGLKRWRRRSCPEEAGSRSGAAEAGEGGFGAHAVAVVAGGDEEDGGGVGADAVELEQLGAVSATSSARSASSSLDVFLEGQDTPAEGPHGDLGGVQHRRHHRGGVVARRRPWARAAGHVTEPFSQLVGAGEAEVADLR